MQGAPPSVLHGEAGARTARRLLFHAHHQGFFSYALLGKDEWERVLLERGFVEEDVDLERGGVSETPHAFQAVRMRYGLDAAGAMLVVALRYAPDLAPEPAAARAARGLSPLPLPEAGKPVVTIGRFARGNWYREINARLAACAAAMSTEMATAGLPFFPPKRWQRFSNSRFPEKGLAVAAGLGSIGRNGLLIAEASRGECEGAQSRGEERGAGENDLLNDGAAFATETPRVATTTTAITTEIATTTTTAKVPFPYASSAVLLGLMLLPFDIEEALMPRRRPPRTALSFCGNCRRCVEACPTGALHVAQQPVFERERCIQYYSSRLETLPAFIEASWQDQLYGCDLCLNACPYFRPDPEAYTDRGAIGGSLDAVSIARMSDDQLRALLKGSSLDQKWIAPGALRRNATLALRKRGASREA